MNTNPTNMPDIDPPVLYTPTPLGKKAEALVDTWRVNRKLTKKDLIKNGIGRKLSLPQQKAILDAMRDGVVTMKEVKNIDREHRNKKGGLGLVSLFARKLHDVGKWVDVKE